MLSLHTSVRGLALVGTFVLASQAATPGWADPAEADRWDILTRYGQRIGYTQTRTTTLPDGRQRTRQITVFGKDIQLVVAGFYYEWEKNDPLKWTAFGFFGNKGYRTRFEREGPNYIYDVGEMESYWISTNAYPSQITQPLIDVMSLSPGFSLKYRVLLEGTGQSLGRSELRVIGKEQVDSHDLSLVEATRIEQLVDEEPRRIFWVDDTKKIVKIDLNGPVSYLADSPPQAREGYWRWPTLDSVVIRLER